MIDNRTNRARRLKKHPNADWPWWKISAIGAFSAGLLGLLVALFPHFSLQALFIGMGLATGMLASGLWNWWTYNWWARVLTGVFATLLFLALAIRCWAMLLPNPWLWAPFIGVGYIAAWLLPAIMPALSSVLWREQIMPQTRVGRFILGASLSLAPVAGVLGASAGMFGSRFGELGLTYLIGGILSSVTAPGIAFAIAYQVWPARPWADQASEGSQLA